MMIDIDHVSFQYSGAEQENLQDFNLQIKKGECVVLTGESGCGKTCVTRLINTLIPHFYEGEMSGAVLIDGVDTRTIQPHDLSDKIGSVFQNPRSQFFSLDTDSEIVFGMENKGMHKYSTFPASTSFIIAKNPGRSKQVPLMPSSVKWTMFVKPCRAANSSNIAF